MQVQLEKFERQDYQRLINWVPDEEFLIQFSGPIFTFPLTAEQLDRYVANPARMIFRVVDQATAAVIGHAELNNIDTRNRSARICRILVGDPESRNKGFGKAIINRLVNYGFEELHLHRIDLGVFDFNKNAIACYESCGFRIEGVFRECYRVGDSYWSSINMAILNPDN